MFTTLLKSVVTSGRYVPDGWTDRHFCAITNNGEVVKSGAMVCQRGLVSQQTHTVWLVAMGVVL